MSEVNKKFSFRVKSESECLVCGERHAKEELLSGGGRLIAGKLTLELRRLYQPSLKWGVICPLAYTLQVCPNCLFTSYSKDFSNLTPVEIELFKTSIAHRRKLIDTLFGNIDFKANRDLVLGAASFVLAVDCYHLRDKSVAPTPKKTISAIRAAWLLDDLYNEVKQQRPYDKARDFYYIETVQGYSKTFKLMQSCDEPIESIAGMLGPDIDHNWGFDGVNYLNAYLTKKFINDIATSPEDRLNRLKNAKQLLSKLYGMGKSNRSKPSIIVDMSKDLYDEITMMIEKG